MANETKVGLLVGMSFIVVFALLLANRGSKQSPGIVRKPLTARGQIVKPSSVSAVEDRMRSAALSSSETAQIQDQLNSSEPVAPTIKQAEDQQPEKADPTPPASAFQRLEDQMRFSPMPKPSKTELAEAPADLSDWINEGALESVEEPRSVVLRSETPEKVAVDSKPIEPEPASNPVHRQHTVKKGETLYKIARDVYGTSSKEVVDQLFKANRTTLKSPNSLQAGDQLVIPSLEGLIAAQAAFDAGSTKAADAEKKSESRKPSAGQETKSKKGDKKKNSGQKHVDAEQEWRWYQVNKGDRYATIAAKQMGSSSHWKKLADFNKDIFPDPAKIRPGVRIRIPVDQLASAN